MDGDNFFLTSLMSLGSNSRLSLSVYSVQEAAAWEI